MRNITMNVPTCSWCNSHCTYPDIVVILDKLRVSEQASLQHGLQQSQVDHVEEQQAQDGEIHDDGKLKENQYFMDIIIRNILELPHTQAKHSAFIYLNGARAPFLIFALTA